MEEQRQLRPPLGPSTMTRTMERHRLTHGQRKKAIKNSVKRKGGRKKIYLQYSYSREASHTNRVRRTASRMTGCEFRATLKEQADSRFLYETVHGEH
jgi:hypothetical protein